MKKIKENFRLLVGIICLTGAIATLSLYAVSCTSENEPQIVNTQNEIKVREIKTFEEMSPELLKLMFGSESRSIDLPTWGDGLNKPNTYEFIDEEAGIRAQMSQSLFDESIVLCSVYYSKSDKTLNMKMQDNGNNCYMLYNEDGSKAAELLYNPINKTFQCSRVFNVNNFCHLAFDISGAVISATTSLTVVGAITFNIAWTILKNYTCDYYFAPIIA